MRACAWAQRDRPAGPWGFAASCWDTGCRYSRRAGHLRGRGWGSSSVARRGAGSMTEAVGLPGGRAASYEVIGSGRPALMFAGGPGFSAAYMTGDAELLSDVLCSYLIDPHGSGSSTPPADPADYSPEGHARFYEEARRALALPQVAVLGPSSGATPAPDPVTPARRIRPLRRRPVPARDDLAAGRDRRRQRARNVADPWRQHARR